MSIIGLIPHVLIAKTLYFSITHDAAYGGQYLAKVCFSSYGDGVGFIFSLLMFYVSIGMYTQRILFLKIAVVLYGCLIVCDGYGLLTNASDNIVSDVVEIVLCIIIVVYLYCGAIKRFIGKNEV